MLTLLRKAYDWLAGIEPLPIDEKIAFTVLLGQRNRSQIAIAWV